MIRFELFRLKVRQPIQLDMLVPEVSNSEIIKEVIESRPSAELRRGHEWRIGNVQVIDEHALYFALGRTTRFTVEVFDEESGEFRHEEYDTAPFTHVLFDTNIQTMAVAAKPNLSPYIKSIARQSERLFNRSEVASSRCVQFSVSNIYDPHSFLERVWDASAVTNFKFAFTKPNPWDEEQDFRAPLARYLDEIEGTAGSTVVKGDNLDTRVIEKVARAAGAAGHDAEATITTENDGRSKVKLRDNPAITCANELETDGHLRNAIERIRAVYADIRRHEEVPESGEPS